MDMGKPENRHFLYAGFYEQEPWGVWSRGHYAAKILFHLPQKRDGKLVFRLVAHSSKLSPKRLKFYINGHRLGEYQFRGDARVKWEPEDFLLDLPERYLTGGIEKLKITCSEGTFVRSGFSRFFGFALKGFGWLSNEKYYKILEQGKK